jgi:L-fuconolactonase
MEITDAYAHCGLRKYKPVEELNRVMDRYGVKRTVLVQHMGEFDNSYIEGLVRENPERFAGVFLVDLAGASPLDDVRRWTERGLFGGIRLPVESLASHAALWQWSAQLGLHFILYGAFNRENLARLASFAGDHPRNAIVLAHLGSPNLKEAPGYASFQPVLELAARPNILVQVSGMHSRSRPPYEDLVPVVRLLYRAMGPSRLLYGSNYPVMGDDEVYGREIELLREARLGIPREAVAAVMNDNAVRVWFGRGRPRAGLPLWCAARG